VCACREPLADDADDGCVDARQRGRKFDPVTFSKSAAMLDRFVLPRNSVQVDGIQIPQADIAEPLPDCRRNPRRVFLLSKRRKDNVLLL
jgi:hypothetical protein